MRCLVLAVFLLFSSLALADSPPAPTNVTGYAPNQKGVHLTWTPVEGATQYWIDRWDRIVVGNPDPDGEGEEGEDDEEEEEQWYWKEVATLGPNFEVFRDVFLPDFAAEEQVVKYRICALSPSGMSEWVEIEVLKPSGPLDLLYEPGEDPETPILREIPEGISARAGEVVNHQIPVFGGSPSSWFEEDLPPGLHLNTTTGQITGTAPDPGVYRFYVGVNFESEAGPRSFKQVRFLRVLPQASSPEIANPAFTLPKQSLGGRAYLSLAGLFRDPARPKGAWFYTNEGSIVVALYDIATPKTVNNFLGYVERGDYYSSFIHRSVADFIIQGGGYRPFSSTSPPNRWQTVAKGPSAPNEPAFTNRKGTIAMAKVGGNRDSATSEWFFNTGTDNAANLDYQNGGFTVFGEVVGSASLQTIERIAALKRGAYDITVEYSGISFTELPVRAPLVPPSLSWEDLVVVYNVDPAPPVEITLISNSAPHLLNASVDGMLLSLEGRGKAGTAHLQLRATNLDGNFVDYFLPVRLDDLVKPSFRLTSLRSVRPYGTVLARGKAKDDAGLGKWRYRINNLRWKKGNKLRGTSSKMKAKMRGFKPGRNLIRIEVFDKKKNSSGVLKLRVVFN